MNITLIRYLRKTKEFFTNCNERLECFIMQKQNKNKGVLSEKSPSSRWWPKRPLNFNIDHKGPPATFFYFFLFFFVSFCWTAISPRASSSSSSFLGVFPTTTRLQVCNGPREDQKGLCALSFPRLRVLQHQKGPKSISLHQLLPITAMPTINPPTASAAATPRALCCLKQCYGLQPSQHVICHTQKKPFILGSKALTP